MVSGPLSPQVPQAGKLRPAGGMSCAPEREDRFFWGQARACLAKVVAEACDTWSTPAKPCLPTQQGVSTVYVSTHKRVCGQALGQTRENTACRNRGADSVRA